MGSVLSADRKPAGTRAETVETTATQSSTLSVSDDIPHDTARPSGPEVAPKPFITRQPSVLAPYTQIRTDEGSSPLSSVESPEEPDLGSSATVPHLFHPQTATGNRNPDGVTPNVGRGTSLLYFHCSRLHHMTLITEMGLCKENRILFF